MGLLFTFQAPAFYLNTEDTLKQVHANIGTLTMENEAGGICDTVVSRFVGRAVLLR